MTALSRQFAWARHKRGNLPLAWQSLQWLSIMTLLSSCIVADPPTYSDAVTTRPELSAYGAHPSVYQVQVIQTPSPSTPTFSVPVRSEDAGEQLEANFFLDYGTPDVTFINGQFIAPSTYNDTSDRTISFGWQSASAQKNCHTLSIVVAHLSSYQEKNAQQLDPQKAEKDAAIITWWVNVNPDANALTTLAGCPGQQVVVK